MEPWAIINRVFLTLKLKYITSTLLFSLLFSLLLKPNQSVLEVKFKWLLRIRKVNCYIGFILVSNFLLQYKLQTLCNISHDLAPEEQKKIPSHMTILFVAISGNENRDFFLQRRDEHSVDVINIRKLIGPKRYTLRLDADVLYQGKVTNKFVYFIYIFVSKYSF